MVKSLKISMLLLSANFIISCILMPEYNYSVEIKNIGQKPVHSVILSKSEGRYVFGKISASGTTAMGIYKYSCRDIFKIAWLDNANREFHKVVDLRSEVPKWFEGNLIFMINNDNELLYKIDLLQN